MAEVKPITYEELEQRMKKADLKATTFKKSPTLDLSVDDKLVVRVKSVVAGEFAEPLVILSETRTFNAEGKYSRPTSLSVYEQDGKDGPRTMRQLKADEDVRLPTFVVRRGIAAGITWHPNQVYWIHYIKYVKVPKGVFRVAAVDLLGVSFPE